MTILVLENYRYTYEPVPQRTSAGDTRSDSDRVRRGPDILCCMSLCFFYIMAAQCCIPEKAEGQFCSLSSCDCAVTPHHVMRADRSYLPCLTLNQSLALRGHSEDVINRVCNCCSLVTAGNLASGEIMFLVLYGNSAVFKADTSKTLRFDSFVSSKLTYFL